MTEKNERNSPMPGRGVLGLRFAFSRNPSLNWPQRPVFKGLGKMRIAIALKGATQLSKNQQVNEFPAKSKMKGMQLRQKSLVGASSSLSLLLEDAAEETGLAADIRRAVGRIFNKKMTIRSEELNCNLLRAFKLRNLLSV